MNSKPMISLSGGKIHLRQKTISGKYDLHIQVQSYVPIWTDI